MPAQWSKTRWPDKADKAFIAAQAAAAAELPIPPPPPLPPVNEKWMARLGSKKFYFTAVGLKAAEAMAHAHFPRLVTTLGEPDITWLGVCGPC